MQYEQGIKWSSSNPSVLQSNGGGKFTAISTGKATISLTIREFFGNKRYLDITDSMEIEVVTESNSKKYTIKYDANGGGTTPPDQIKLHGLKIPLSSAISRNGYEFLGWAKEKDADSPLFKAGAYYTANASVTLYAVWRIAEGSVLADFNLPWYVNNREKGSFNISNSPQCPWFVYGRVAEVHGVRINLSSITDIYGERRSGSGGWWIKTFVDADYVKLNDDNSWSITEKNPNVRIERDPYLIKPKSVACFLYYVTGYGFAGHIVFIEDVITDINGEKFVYVSESNTGSPSGAVKIETLNKFLTRHDKKSNGLPSEKYNGEPIFQGYIQFN